MATDAILLIFSLNPQIKDFIKHYSEEGTVHVNDIASPPTIDFVNKINHRFLKDDVTNVMRSIGKMYEFDYKWANTIEHNDIIPD